MNENDGNASLEFVSSFFPTSSQTLILDQCENENENSTNPSQVIENIDGSMKPVQAKFVRYGSMFTPNVSTMKCLPSLPSNNKQADSNMQRVTFANRPMQEAPVLKTSQTMMKKKIINKSCSTSGRTFPAFQGIPNQRSIKVIDTLMEKKKIIQSCSTVNKGNKMFPFVSTIVAAKTKEICFHLMSTWGQSDTMSLSEIDVLNEARQVLPVLDVKSFPFDSSNPEKLVDQNLIKKDNDSCWKTKFDKTKGAIIIITVDATTEPCFVRIWNNQKDPVSSVKTFEIYINKEYITGGDLPQNFGQIVSLYQAKQSPALKSTQDIQQLLQMFEEEKPAPSEFLTDMHGQLPTKLISKITIVFLKTHDGSPLVGLNAIQLYDLDGKLIDIFDNAVISTNQIKSQNNLRSLFTDNAARSDPEKMWKGIILNIDKPSITITFTHKIYLGSIKIYNYNGSGEECGCGANKIRVEIDDKLVYTGAIKKCTGSRFNVEDNVKLITLFHSKPLYLSQKF